MKMTIDESEDGLKGQDNLAQGKRSGAVRLSSRRSLGLENGKENRPRENVHKRENLISDEMDDPVFPRNDAFQFRPKGMICFVHRILADGFSSASYTQGGVSDRSSRNSAVPVPILSGGYNVLAFQAVRNSTINLSIKSISQKVKGKIIADDQG